MRITAGVIVDPCEIPEIYVKSTSAQRQTDGRRAGLKIRWRNTRVGSSPTFGTLPSGREPNRQDASTPPLFRANPFIIIRSTISIITLACESERLRASADSQRNCYRTATGEATDPDLATVINAWNRLPEAVRAGIVAMVKTTSGKGS